MRTLAISALALAAVATPAFAQSGTFTGPHAEVIGGWDRVEGDVGGKSGFAYGLAGGYDMQLGSIVVGAEAEVASATTKECYTNVAITGDELCAKAARDLYVGGRVGFVTTPQSLLYAKVGYTNARQHSEYDSNATVGSFERGDNLDGIRLGAGYEYNFGKFLGKVEYRYSNYSQDAERHQVVAGLGFRF